VTGNSVVATVAGRRIRLSDVEARASILHSRPAARHAAPDEAVGGEWIRRWAVQQLVGEAVLEHEIRAPGEPVATDRRDAAIERLVARITQPIEVSERAVRSFYERNLDRYRTPERRRVCYVALTNRHDAERVRQRLIAEAIDATTGPARQGVMELRRGEYVGAFETVVFAARAGDVVGPTLTEHGWMVARVDSVTAESTVPYSVARAVIAGELLEVTRAHAFDEWLDVRRHQLGRVAPEYEHPAHPVHGQPRHRH
jgi:hypothetical protein